MLALQRPVGFPLLVGRVLAPRSPVGPPRLLPPGLGLQRRAGLPLVVVLWPRALLLWSVPALTLQVGLDGSPR